MSDGDDSPARGTGPADDALLDVLARSRELGFLGPGPIVFHVEHSESFLLAIRDDATMVPGAQDEARILDLGSGGGVPGLVLARALPSWSVVLLDAMQRRCQFLEAAIQELQLGDRVMVRCGRAEQLAHDTDLRGSFDVVVTRGFGPPAVTAECGAAFLRAPGGRLLVSEPPDDTIRRWPSEGLAELGLTVGARVRGPVGTVQVLAAASPPPARFPRRTGVPAKRPLF